MEHNGVVGMSLTHTVWTCVMEHVGMSLTHTVWTCVIQTKHISTKTTEILKYAKIRFYFFFI